MESIRAKAMKVACLLTLVGLCAPTALAQDAVIERLKSFRFGDDRAILDSVSQRVSESRSDPTVRFYVARALAGVLDSDAAFDAKQFACRQLAFVGTEEQVPALAKLLRDEELSHYALMALARIPGPAVGEALRKGLAETTGRAQIGIIDALGDRRDRAAGPLLQQILDGTDRESGAAAAYALGKIADHPSLDALMKAFSTSDAKSKSILGDALLKGARRLAQPQDARKAISIYVLLNRESKDPVLHAGALRGIVAVAGEGALTAVVKALREDGTLRQAAAADAARTLPGKATTAHLTEALHSLTPHGRMLLIGALADRGDRSAAPAVAALTRDPDPEVRLAAVRALATMGDANSVLLLLQSAAAGGPEMREAAQSSLSRIRAAGVDEKLLQIAQTGPAKTRVQAIESLGRRRVSTGVQALVLAAKSKETGVSAAALRVLRDAGRPDVLPPLLDLLTVSPAENRADISETISEIARRETNESRRTGVILDRLAKTTRPVDRVELFSILRQVGGPNALAALRTATKDPSPDVRTGAIRQLAEWPSGEPMPELLQALKTAKDRRQRTLALRGYIRMIGLDERRPSDQTLLLYRETATFATTADEKRLILAGVGKLHTLGALELAATYLKDDDLRAEAELAVIEAARATAGAYPDQTRAALDPIVQGSPNEDARNKARAILELMAKFGEFVTAWEVSPAYQQTNAGHTQLFDIPFPPEDPAKENEVAWRLMPAGGSAEQPWLLDLLATLGGDQRVAYLRTSVWSDIAQELTMEMGSDDGIKVWCNGKVVHVNNTARAAAPGQDRFSVSLKPGRNDLLVKVTQNVLGWGACARFTNADGGPARGLKYTIPSEK